MQLDAELFFESDLKLQNAGWNKTARVGKLLSELGFTSEKPEVMMDVGCGYGNVTKDIIHLFPNLKKIIGMDMTPGMIELAKIHNPHPKIEYVVANIEDRSTLQKWMGEITKLIALYSFNLLKNQRAGFENVYDLLKPGGEAVFKFPLGKFICDSIIEIGKDRKYSTYFKEAGSLILESYYHDYDAEHYRKMLEDIGFNVIHCKKEKEGRDSEDRRFLDLFYPVHRLTKYIPENLREEFKEDFSIYIEKGLVKNGGVFCRMEILIRKGE